MSRIDTLTGALRHALGDRLSELIVALGEVTVVVRGRDQLQVARALRDDAALAFEQLIDLAGIDYSSVRRGLVGRTALRRRHAPAVAEAQLAGEGAQLLR